MVTSFQLNNNNIEKLYGGGFDFNVEESIVIQQNRINELNSNGFRCKFYNFFFYKNANCKNIKMFSY